MKKKQTFYYSDELNDEFFKTNYKIKRIDKHYKYVSSSIFYKLYAFVLYRLVATTYAFIYSKIVRRIKIKNKGVLKPFKKNGYFVFANHTHAVADAFTPTTITFPKKCYSIVNADNMSIPVLGKVVKALGALPLPDDYVASKNFMKALEYRLNQRAVIIVYPEAHIWPFYTAIRPFPSTAFKYAIKYNAPTFTFTTTYQRKKRGFKTVIYVDGPFYPQANITAIGDRAEALRNLVYDTMVKRSKNSNFEKIKYIKIEEKIKNDKHNF